MRIGDAHVLRELLVRSRIKKSMRGGNSETLAKSTSAWCLEPTLS